VNNIGMFAFWFVYFALALALISWGSWQDRVGKGKKK
jgi:hypothetical protein